MKPELVHLYDVACWLSASDPIALTRSEVAMIGEATPTGRNLALRHFDAWTPDGPQMAFLGRRVIPVSDDQAIWEDQ